MAEPSVLAALARPYQIDRSKDIPYLAGYSTDGGTIFIDRHLPETIQAGGKSFDPAPFLVVHEHTEKALIDALGYKYAAAHEIASRMEDRAVISAGLNRVAYNDALKPYIKADEAEALKDVPADLDLTPYAGEPALLARMKAAMHVDAR